MLLPELGFEGVLSLFKRTLIAVAGVKFIWQCQTCYGPESFHNAKGELVLHDTASREAINHNRIVIQGVGKGRLADEGLVRKAGRVNSVWHERTLSDALLKANGRSALLWGGTACA